jgi:hypothetical protein
MRRRMFALFGSAMLAAAALTVAGAPPGAASPVAEDEATYQQFGRVFPDPHGCLDGAPGTSPWAKGDVCAVQFIQYAEAIDGLKFLEQRFPRYLRLFNLRTQFGDQFPAEEMRSAGLPRLDLSRLRSDLHVVKVTDARSPVPEADRKHFAYALSIHGIERAGVEGGIRAAEDLVSWAACEADPGAAPACAEEGPFPKRILEPSDSGPTAGEVLTNSVIYFVLANPDGWRRGDLTEGGVFYQRYNGNGMDLNRDWPTIGYTEGQYTPLSEPETRGFGAFLKSVRERTSGDAFTGAIDLHGMLTAPSFSFTLLGAGQRDFRRNAITVDTAIRTYRDSEQRLSWSSLIATGEDCPGPVEVPELGGNVPMCSDQWGTVWDTINYQITGGFGDWMESPLGLDGLGIDNEMALSHLTFNNVFDPEVEQLHIDGNKGLIYAQIASLLFEQPVEFRPGGKVGYIFDPRRISSPGGEPVEGPEGLPTQDTITQVQPTGIAEFPFDVKGVPDGFFNGGLTVEATFGNADAISPSAAATLILDYCGPPLHPGDEQGCREVARYFNQSPLYLQAGARIDLNSPPAGPYRIRANPARALPTRYEVSFSSGQAYPQPEQLSYDVSRMDFFTDLNRYVPDGMQLEAIPVKQVLRQPRTLRQFDTIVIANDVMPGIVTIDDLRKPQPAGTPQPGESFAFGPEAAAVPQVGPQGVHEFEVKEGFDNDQIVVSASWAVPSDYDVFVEFFNPATNAWEERGCECSFIEDEPGEQVTVLAPEPGKWRVRLANFAAAPQPVDGTIEFAALPSPGTGEVQKQFARYAGHLAEFAGNGGNLVLTDNALAALPFLGTGIQAKRVHRGVFYAGWMDFDDLRGPTYERHRLATGVDMEGTAEGMATADGQRFDNRHQTYEPVPIGYYVGPGASANSACDTDRCDSPNWTVNQTAWESAGGTTAARTLARESEELDENGNPSPSTTGVSLGELGYGTGAIRIAGGLLPDPTEQNLHPFGLRSYALTYTGYQVFENLVNYQR